VLVRLADRLAMAEGTVEADRERARGVVGDRPLHAERTPDHVAERLGLRVAVARVEHDQANRTPRRLDHLCQGGRHDRLRSSVVAHEEQAGRVAGGFDVARGADTRGRLFMGRPAAAP
jgi:hypothetical protein